MLVFCSDNDINFYRPHKPYIAGALQRKKAVRYYTIARLQQQIYTVYFVLAIVSRGARLRDTYRTNTQAGTKTASKPLQINILPTIALCMEAFVLRGP